MESFRVFMESINQDRQKLIFQNKLQQISNALIKMQMIEKDFAVGTPNYMPPESARGLKTNSLDSWQMMNYALKDHPEQKTAKLLQDSFQKLMWGWDRFLDQVRQDYNISVDRTAVQEAFNPKDPIMNRIIKHSYDAVNRQQLKPSFYSIKPTPASLRMGRQRREELFQAKKAHKSGLEPNTLGYIQREQAEELKKKYFELQSAISNASAFINQFLASSSSKSANFWNSFLNYQKFWSDTVKTNLPKIINSLPKREIPTPDMAPTIDYRHD